MRILVTGGAGFIGSHLSERLLSDGHSVTVLDNCSTGLIGNLTKSIQHKDFTLSVGSILDQKLVTDLVINSDFVFHLAAAVGVFNIVNKPLDSLMTNIRGTENVLDACAIHQTPFLLASSSEVYGKNSADSLRESDDRVLGSPTTLRWSYSEAKAIDESLTYAYFLEKGLETRIVRLFNTVGPRQIGTHGMVFPRFIESALSGQPLSIYGSGQQTRCFTHVFDVVDALMLIAFSKNTIGKVINIGNNLEISIAELAHLVLAKTKSQSSIEFIPYMDAYGINFEDMVRRVPNLDLIFELVGWTPRRSLEETINDTICQMSLKGL